MRYGICIVATVSCCRFEKNVGDFELKDLIIVLVGANFFHRIISPKRSPLKARHKYLSGRTINGVSCATDPAHFLSWLATDVFGEAPGWGR
jgi:hypothetical protein